MDIWGILEYTAAVSVVGLLIWLVKGIFHDKLDARWHSFIWLVLLVRIVVPVRFELISTPFSVFQEIPLRKWIAMGRLLAEKRGYGELAAWLGWAWLGGAVLLGSFYLVMWTVLRIRIAGAPEADGGVKAYVDGIAAKYGLKSCKDIRILKSSTPYICGVLRPVLVLPESPEGAGGAELREQRREAEERADPAGETVRRQAGGRLPEEAVIVHELLHRKYGDVLVNIGLHAVRAVNWFNPVVWILTSVVQNDSEALCDQRVLERCGGEKARDYGELLISMSEGRGRNPVKAGTSNMASSYRDMKIRIRRIRDFKRVPGGVGLVALCITLMLALAGISSSAEEEEGFSVSDIASERELELALLQARLYHARTPQEAVYLFLRSIEEKNMVYRMAVMPEEEISRYESFALEWFQMREAAVTWAELADGGGYPAYFPGKTVLPVPDRKQGQFPATECYRIYNLQYDEREGSAVVCVYFRGENGRCHAEWKLALVKEEGWKAWLEEESEVMEGLYQPEALLSCSAQLGDFLVEVYGYNEGYFQELDNSQGGNVFSILYEEGAQKRKAVFPTCFSQEYKYQDCYVTYLGEADLEGHGIRVVTAGDREDEWYQKQVRTTDDQEPLREAEKLSGAWESQEPGELPEAGKLQESGKLLEAGAGKPGSYAGSYSYGSSKGQYLMVFDGKELMGGERQLAGGGGSGYSSPGYCWKAGDRIGAYVAIFVDGVLAEEGEVWSETL